MVRFKQLWENHPTIQNEKYPCKSESGKKYFDDQCAIRLGTCLANCGIDTTKIVPKRRHCWHHDVSRGHILSAEELAEGLKWCIINGLQKMEEINPSDYQRDLNHIQGIIFFKDFWQRTVNGNKETFRNRSGDHIDLWNGSRLTDWRTWFAISSVLNTGGVYGKSKEIWFWRVL
jgi:hypothetical protein